MDQAVNLDRLELVASYSAGALEPQDADAGREGVQLEIGPVFTNGYSPENLASDGTLRLTISRFPAYGSFYGTGLMAAVTFQAREDATLGSYSIHLDAASTQLLDPDGDPLASGGLTDGTVRIASVPPSLEGWITREAVWSQERTAVTALFYWPGSPYEPISWARACTDSHGDFALPVPEGEVPIPTDLPLPSSGPPADPYEWAFVRLDFPNYLSECYWKRVDNAVVGIGYHVLEGGDVNGDGCINIIDIVRIISHFGETAPSSCYVPFSACPSYASTEPTAPLSDVNADCRVNIFDLTMAAENFGLCSSCR